MGFSSSLSLYNHMPVTLATYKHVYIVFLPSAANIFSSFIVNSRKEVLISCFSKCLQITYAYV